MWVVQLREAGGMTGVDNSKAKICVKCKMIVATETLVCPDCGGIIFESVDFGGRDE